MNNTLRTVCCALLVCLLCGCSDKNDKIGKTEVVIETDRGKITLRLFDDTPVHRDNFIRLAKAGAYDGIIWHRVVKDMLIQSGDPRLKARGEELTVDTSEMHYTLPQEIRYPRHFHRAGALAAAREGNDVNPEKRSSGTQFYIVGGTVYTPGKLAEVHQLMQDADTLHRIPAFTEFAPLFAYIECANTPCSVRWWTGWRSCNISPARRQTKKSTLSRKFASRG